jgi:hypothetical protein
MSVTDRLSPRSRGTGNSNVTDPQLRDLTQLGIRNGPVLCCACCERLIPRTEPVYLDRGVARGPRSVGTVYVCADCWAKPAEERVTGRGYRVPQLTSHYIERGCWQFEPESTIRETREPCAWCGRLVVVGWNPQRLWTTCSEHCRGAARREDAHRIRRYLPDRCQGCNKPMPGRRRGARFCSLACKQRTYRQRVTEQRAVPA